MGNKIELNKREKDILEYIEEQVNVNGYPPSVREIGKAVGLSSTATVHTYLAKLEEKGYIKKESQKGRTLKLLKTKKMKFIIGFPTILILQVILFIYLLVTGFF